MNQLALIDCPTGLAGNMLLASLLDLGLPPEVIDAPLAALGLAHAYRLVVQERRSGGLRGLHVEVELLEASPPDRPWGDLRQQILAAPLDGALQTRVLDVFTLLAAAEAVVHGVAPDQVHFHELGAVDALVDVVGVCAGLLHFGVNRLVCSPPPGGHGSVATAHGPLPLPAPAVLEIARQRRVPLASSEGFPAAELTTPTGLALVACWADRFGVAPSHIPQAIGMGLGTHQLDRPNLLRLTLAGGPQVAGAQVGLAEVGLEQQEILEQQAQIDDASAEDLAFLVQALRDAGAKEVFSQAIAMKKGRQGHLLTVLVDPAAAEVLREVWWQHSTTLGLRESRQLRWVLPRRSLEIATALGSVRFKQAQLPDGRWRSKPEHDDLIALASRHNLGLDQVRTIVLQALTAMDLEQQP